MNNYKSCTKCNKEQPIDNFSKDKQRKDGRYPHCRDCQRLKIQQWSVRNKEHISDYHKRYNIECKEKRKQYRIKTRLSRARYMREWRKSNCDAIRTYKQVYHKSVESKKIDHRILHALRNRLRLAIKSSIKSKHTLGLVGCSMDKLKEYLSSKFTNGMNWDNYGRNGWHIDHIKPCCSFNLSDPLEQEKCFHYTNLQPLWAIDNCIKNRY